MVTILTPEQVKTDSNRAREEQIARVRDLASEEERLITSVNSLRDEEVAVKQSVDENLKNYRAIANEKKAELEREVSTLETRRADAMKPVNEIRKEAEGRIIAVGKREEAVSVKEKEVKEASEQNTELAEELADRRQELDEREEKIKQREKSLKAEEEEVRRSENKLSDRWAEFHIAVNTKNGEISDKEKVLSAREAVLDIRGNEQATRQAEQDARERELSDRYSTLERAIKEAEKRNKTT